MLPLVSQLSRTNHLKNMPACKNMEEHIFYINMCIKEHLSKRELERKIDSGYYERYMLPQKPLTYAPNKFNDFIENLEFAQSNGQIEETYENKK